MYTYGTKSSVPPWFRSLGMLPLDGRLPLVDQPSFLAAFIEIRGVLTTVYQACYVPRNDLPDSEETEMERHLEQVSWRS